MGPALKGPRATGWAWLSIFARYSLRKRIAEKLMNLIVS